MNATLDEEIVATWSEPLSLRDIMRAVRDAGFSGDVYRETYADLAALLETEEAGTLHFLRHGYAEGRVFRTGCDPGGLTRLRRLALHNRVYLQNLLVALATAWAGSHVRTVADIAVQKPTIAQLRGLGAVPYLILGDASSDLYRRGVSGGASGGERWLCPLAMAPIEGGIEELLRTPVPSQVLPRPDPDQPPMPVIWKFGQADVQVGYLAHRLRHGISTADSNAFLAFAASLVESYAGFLEQAVPAAERSSHWVAGLFPPVWQVTEREQPAARLVAEFGDAREMIAAAGLDTLLDRTMMHRTFNTLLHAAVSRLGFNGVTDFDSFLSGHGTIDDHYLVAMKDQPEMDYQASRGILSTSLWALVDRPAKSAAGGGIRGQFEHLLEEIRLVQMGQIA